MAKVFWTAVNTEKNHPASSPEPRDKAIIEWTWVPSKTQSAGHSFLMDFSTGTVDTKDPASSLLRSWFSWHANQPTLNSGTQTSPSWNRILIRSISDSKTSTLVCGCQDVSPLEVWSDPDTIFRLEAQPIAHRCSKIPRWVWPNLDWDPVTLYWLVHIPWNLSNVVSLNTQTGVCVPYCFKNPGLDVPKYPNECLCETHSDWMRKSGPEDP